MSGQTVEEMTADAWRALQAARRAAGEPWRDDSDKDIFWLARECEAVRDRCIARIGTPFIRRRNSAANSSSLTAFSGLLAAGSGKGVGIHSESDRAFSMLPSGHLNAFSILKRVSSCGHRVPSSRAVRVLRSMRVRSISCFSV